MATSAEQVHQGNVNIEPKKGKDKRLFIDLDICAAGECKDCVIKCSYLYHRQNNNNGILSVAELATYLRRQFAPDKPVWADMTATVGRIRRQIAR